MYFPYFRGKQYELITIRETAPLLSEMSFVPIIEPVREETSGLRKALEAVSEANARAIVILNPAVGDFQGRNEELTRFVEDGFQENRNIVGGVLLTENTTIDQFNDLLSEIPCEEVALIHSGFSDGKLLADEISDNDHIKTSVFLDGGKLYQRHFRNHQTRVLVKDGFEQRTNREHPPDEIFSDLHITFPDENMDGFGDFLIVGKPFIEGGGPAYTVAIHLTYIDEDRDEAMYVRHFKSSQQDTPKNPGGKFADALAQLVRAVDAPNTKFWNTTALDEFRELHRRGHYPGLGYIKKLSMRHHIETLAEFFRRTRPVA